MSTRKSMLIKFIESSIECGKAVGVVLVIANPDMYRPEEIYNPIENLRYKVEYISKAYDDDLHLKANQKIVIESAYPVYAQNVKSFSWALEALKRGEKVCRRGWNGKNQYIELASNISYTSSNGDIVNAEHNAIGNKAIAFVGTSGVQLGWLASQSDMLAMDWEIAEGGF